MYYRGHFIGDALYLAVHFCSQFFEEMVWLLCDIGASRTTILDRDIKHLKIPRKALEPAEIPIVGIGGSVRSFVLKDIEIAFVTNEGVFTIQQNIWVTEHDIEQLPPDEVSRILRLPSVLGHDIINRFRFLYDYNIGKVLLEQKWENRFI